MEFREIFRIIGLYLYGFSWMFLIPLLVAAYYQFFAETNHPQPHSGVAFLISFVFCLATAQLFYWFGKKAKGNLYKKEAIIAVVAIWFISPVIAGMPFILSGTLTNPLQAYFEAASGLSTTGATVLYPKAFDADGNEVPIKSVVRGELDTTYTFYGTVSPIRDPVTNKIIHEGIEAVSKPLLLWRSLLNWLGGLGIIVLFVAILPNLGMSGKFLFQSEVTGPWKDPHAPRIGQAALQLWGIYAGLTALQIALLMIADTKMEWFDAINTSLSTVSGGGFSIHNKGIGNHLQNPYIDWIIIIFMVVASTNFAVYYHAFRGKFYRIYRPELFLYLFILVGGSLLASWFLVGTPKLIFSGDSGEKFSAAEAIRYGSFQFVAAQTTVGFADADYDRWPYVIQVMMLIAMFVGGMSGSTASGAKVIRIYMLYYMLRNKLRSLFRADTIRSLKVGSQEVDLSTANTVLCYLLIVVIIAAAGTFLYVMDGVDPETSLGLVACMMNNVGMGFRVAGPANSCAFMSDFSLAFSSLLMIMGRLEFLVVLALLMPTFWKQNA